MRKIFDFVFILLFGISLGYFLRDLVLIKEIKRTNTITLDGVETYKCWKEITL